MADILKKIKDWDFTSKDSNITMNLDYTELAEISDVVDRKLWFADEVDDYNANNIIYSILKYNAQDKGTEPDKRKPIILYIGSPGGNTYSGLALISAIKASETPIYTVVLSTAMSMALIIAIAGDKRYCMSNSVYLMHDGFLGAANSTNKVKDQISFETGAMEDRIKSIILDNTKLTKKQYDEKYRQEWYFFPDIAKKYGFVDYIIGEDCELDEII